MLSRKDVNSITAFSRVCCKNNVPRDMETEVLQYFFGLFKGNLYLLQFWVLEGGDGHVEIDEEYHKLFDKSHYESTYHFYLAIVKHVVNIIDKTNNMNWNAELVMSVRDDCFKTLGLEYINGEYNDRDPFQHEMTKTFLYSQLVNKLMGRWNLSDNDLPMYDLTYMFKKINLIEL